MRIQVLGCSGGIGEGRHTTSFLIDDDILVDCGTGITTLDHAALCRIDHVFLTHAHLDHILCLPLLLDSVAGERKTPVVIHALPEVIDILQGDIFNWRVWPDFAVLPTPQTPFCVYDPIAMHQPARVGDRVFLPIPANHVVPAVSYRVGSSPGAGHWLFSGDTCGHEAFWATANATQGELHVVVECSFEDALCELAAASKHYCAAALAADLRQLRPGAKVWITHLKPGGEDKIMAELASHGAQCTALRNGQVIEL